MVMPSADVSAVIIDNGTGTIKGGLAGDDAPRSIFSTVVGKPKMPGILVGLDQKDVYIGDEVKEKKGVLKLEYPIDRGIIKDWENMEKIWNYTIDQELKTTPEEQAVLLTEPPLNPKENREKIVRVMFETFNVPCLYLGVQTVLSLYASGRTSGLVVEIGEGMTNIAPIYEGFAVPFASSRIPLAGKDLTAFLQESLRRNGYSFTASDELEWVQWLKEKACQVAPDYEIVIKEAAESKAVEKAETLPDGNTVVTMGIERYQVPEILFNPAIAGKDMNGIHKLAADAIGKCEQEVRKELYKNVILSGGSTMFPFMSNRIKSELTKLVPGKAEIGILAPPERKYSAWIGGSIVASLSTFSAMYISRNDYNDVGPEIVHRKCY